jgi:hypothetical protein
MIKKKLKLVPAHVMLAPGSTPSLVKHDKEKGYIDVYWGGYEYSIALDRIPTPLSLLEWVHHMSEKGWDETTPERISRFIAIVCTIKGWKLHGNH